MNLVSDLETRELDSSSEPAYLFLKGLINSGSRKYVSNTVSEILAIVDNEHSLSVAIPDPVSQNCYVCSIRSHYETYARHEIKERGSFISKPILHLCVSIIGLLLRIAKCQEAVYVNNWLLSTNLYPDGLESKVSLIRNTLADAYPNKAIIFRSLNREYNKTLCEALDQASFRKLCSRAVFLLDPSERNPRSRSDFRRDLKLLQRTKFQIIPSRDFNEGDLPAANQLYRKLYLNKHTDLNPHFTERMFLEGYRTGFLNFVGIKDGSELVGVVGFYRIERTITAPIIGYDTSRAQKDGLYRLLTVLLTLEAEEGGCRLNRSSGAEHFKMQRGAKPEIEYSYIYWKHLPGLRRAAWRIFAGIINKVGEFSLKKLTGT